MSDILKEVQEFLEDMHIVDAYETVRRSQELHEKVEAARQGGQNAEPIGTICDDGEGAYVELYDDYSFLIGQPVYTQPQPAGPEVLALCSECHQEFSVPLESGGNATTDLLCNFCNCPHCGERVDLWIKLSTPTTPKADGWVRCEDRLPTEADADMNGKVWCFLPERGLNEVALFGVKEVNFFWGRDQTITHWMPTGLKRPQPPADELEK